MAERGERVERFEEWARQHRPKMRSEDRLRVASELFGIAGDAPVVPGDVDSLVKRYRDGLLGAQAVLTVRRVGDDVLLWQEQQGNASRSVPPRRSERPLSRNDDDEAEELDLQPDDEGLGPSSVPASARAWARRGTNKSSAPPAGSASRPQIEISARVPTEEVDRSMGSDEMEVIQRWTFEESEDPRSRRRDMAAMYAESRQSERSGGYDRRQDPPSRGDRRQLFSDPHLSLPDPPPLDDPPRSSTSALRAASSRPPSAAIAWSEPPRAPSSSSPSHSRPPSVPPLPRSDPPEPSAFSSAPPPSSPALERFASDRPLRDGSEPPRAEMRPAPLREDEPHWSALPASSSNVPPPKPATMSEPPSPSSPSSPPSSRPPPPEGAVKPSSSPPAAGVPSRSRRPKAGLDWADDSPLSRPPPPRSAAPPVIEAESDSSGMVIKIGAVVLAVVVIVVVIAKSGLVFSRAAVDVNGLFLSKHLRVSLTFPEPWLHAESLDAHETTHDGYQRNVSVFYQGRSSDDFTSEIAVVSFERAGKSADDMVSGDPPAEVAAVSNGRKCQPLDDARKGYRCESFTTRGEHGFGTLEEYFAVGSRVVLVRGLVEAAAGPVNEKGEITPASPPDYAAIEEVSRSIESYDPK